MKVTLSLKNHTRYDTAFLRALCRKLLAASRREEKRDFPVRVICNSARQNSATSGHAYLNGRTMRIHLEPKGTARVAEVAAVFLHELDHLRGYGHKAMPEFAFYRRRAAQYLGLRPQDEHPEDWAAIVPQAPEKLVEAAQRPPRPSLMEKRLARARVLHARAEADLMRTWRLWKRARDREEVWRQKIKRYEAKLAAPAAGE